MKGRVTSVTVMHDTATREPRGAKGKCWTCGTWDYIGTDYDTVVAYTVRHRCK